MVCAYVREIIHWLNLKTTTRSRWGAIANPHPQVFDPQYPQAPPLGHDPSDRMKILFDMFHIIYLLSHTMFGIKNLCN